MNRLKNGLIEDNVVAGEGKGTFFLKLMNLLAAEKIPYCVVGNTAGFPKTIESDVDMVVSPAHVAKVISLLLAEQTDFKLVQVLQHEQNAYYMVLALLENQRLKPMFLHPDVCGDYYRYGRLLLQADALLKDRRFDPEKQCPVASPQMEYLYYLLKRIDKQSLNVSHGSHLQAQYLQAPAQCAEALQPYWRSENERELLCQASARNHWEPVNACIQNLKQSLQPLRPCGGVAWLRETQRKIKRLLQPTGLWVVFLGVDGSGKSSVWNQVQSDLAPVFRRVDKFHLRPGTRIPEEHVGSVDNPHAQPARGLFLSWAKLVYFWLDCVLGYWLVTWPAKVRSGLVIFDRYLVDMKIDPKRFRLGGPAWPIRLLEVMIPQPDLYLLLDASPEVLQSRKKEVPFEETARQRNAYLEWAKSHSRCRVLDAALPLDEVVAQANHEILSFLAARTQSRWGQ